MANQGKITQVIGNVVDVAFDTENAKLPNILDALTVTKENGQVVLLPEDVDDGSTVGCGIMSLSVSPNTFTCANVGANIITLTATDVNGNSNTGTATVTVQDTVSPTVVTQNITVQLDAAGNASITATDIDNGSSDNCSIASSSVDISSFTCAEVGANTVTLTVTDANGNISTGTAIITVEDNGEGFDWPPTGKPSGIGLRNIQSRLDILSGSMSIDSKKKEGTSIHMEIPLQVV